MRAHRECTLGLISLLGEAYDEVLDGGAVELTVDENVASLQAYRGSQEAHPGHAL